MLVIKSSKACSSFIFSIYLPFTRDTLASDCADTSYSVRMRVCARVLLEIYVSPLEQRRTTNTGQTTRPSATDDADYIVSWIFPVPISSRTLRLLPLPLPLTPSVLVLLIHHRFSILSFLFASNAAAAGSIQSITPARLSTHIFDCSANMPKFILRPLLHPFDRPRSVNARFLPHGRMGRLANTLGKSPTPV